MDAIGAFTTLSLAFDNNANGVTNTTGITVTTDGNPNPILAAVLNAGTIDLTVTTSTDSTTTTVTITNADNFTFINGGTLAPVANFPAST